MLIRVVRSVGQRNWKLVSGWGDAPAKSDIVIDLRRWNKSSELTDRCRIRMS